MTLHTDGLHEELNGSPTLSDLTSHLVENHPESYIPVLGDDQIVMLEIRFAVSRRHWEIVAACCRDQVENKAVEDLALNAHCNRFANEWRAVLSLLLARLVQYFFWREAENNAANKEITPSDLVQFPHRGHRRANHRGPTSCLTCCELVPLKLGAYLTSYLFCWMLLWPYLSLSINNCHL